MSGSLFLSLSSFPLDEGDVPQTFLSDPLMTGNPPSHSAFQVAGPWIVENVVNVINV